MAAIDERVGIGNFVLRPSQPLPLLLSHHLHGPVASRMSVHRTLASLHRRMVGLLLCAMLLARPSTS